MERPNQACVADISYVWTHEDWMHLSVVSDLYFRKIVGWSMSHRMTSCLVCDALQMAIWKRRVEKGLIFPSTAASDIPVMQVRRLWKAIGIMGSMSRNGDCWDNSVVEGFFGTLKFERVHCRSYQTRAEHRAGIVDYITMRNNSHRLRSYLGHVNPDDYERRANWPKGLDRVSVNS